jgi:predicted RNA-binding Zn-ribbon protein involved in translation (DUF1610 family)
MKCSKCGTEAPGGVRFCPRCHATLVFRCPSCQHEQGHGGVCDNCGVDFVKYFAAVLAAKKDQADAARDRLEQRTSLAKNILLLPFNLGIPLLRQLLRPSKRRG